MCYTLCAKSYARFGISLEIWYFGLSYWQNVKQALRTSRLEAQMAPCEVECL